MVTTLLRAYCAILLVMTALVATAPATGAMSTIAWPLFAPGYGAALLAQHLEIPYAHQLVTLLPPWGGPIHRFQLFLLFLCSIVPLMLVSFVNGLLSMPETLQKSPGMLFLYPLKVWLSLVMLFGVVMTIFSRSV